MRAIEIKAHGGPEQLVLVERPLPEPGPGEIRVRHAYCGVNFIDVYHRTGLYPITPPPGIGLEASGVVDALGAGVTSLKLGDRVGYCTGPRAAYAEANVVPAGRVVRLPAGLDDALAASVLLKGMTAEYLLRRTFAVQPGQTILFHAAAGGVGQIACQWAKHLGATVIGTVGSDAKIATAKAHGCDHVIVTAHEDISARVKDITKGAGVPVVYDSVGRDTFQASLDCLMPRGLFVTFGNASGPVPPVAPALLSAKSLYMTRPGLFHYTATQADLQMSADALFAVLPSGAVKLAAPKVYPLSAAAEAHADLEARRTTGSLVLKP